MTHTIDLAIPRGRARTGRVTVEWLRDPNSIAALEPEWRALESRVEGRMIYASPDYVLPWYRNLGGLLGEPLLAVLRRDGALVGLAPLARWKGTLRRVPLRRIDFVGHHWEGGELLLEDDAPDLAAAFLESLLAEPRWDLLVVPSLTGKARRASVLHEVARRHRRHTGIQRYWYAVVDLREGYEGYCRRMSRNFRRTLHRQAARVDAAGGASIDRILPCGEPVTIDSMLERMFAISDKSWKARRPGRRRDRHRRFEAAVLRSYAQRGDLDLAILKIGGVDAAFVAAIVERGTYYDFTVSYDAQFESLSPGAYLLQRVIETLPTLGVVRVVSHGAHEYKRRWATDFVSQERLFVFGRGLRAALGHWVRFAIPSPERSEDASGA